MTATPGKLPVGDDDGDFFSDPDVAEERAEAISVANQPADLTGYINAHSIQGNNLSGLTLAMDVCSFVVSAGTFIFPPTAPLGFIFWTSMVGEALQVISSLNEQFTLQDPYDPNYHTLYEPKSITLPSLPNDPSIPSQFITDARGYGQAATSVASYADAVYVTQNRMLSAINDGDLAGFQLQNAQLNKLVFLLGNAHTVMSQATTELANDFASAGWNVSVTPQQFTDFIHTLSVGGFSALPQAEQDIINQFSTDPGVRDALINLMTSVQLNAPTDLVSTLKLEASANASLGATYSLPNDPNAIANVHQAIITSAAINDTLTEHGSPLSEAGTIAFLDTNSTLFPTASVTATTVTATDTGLLLTDAQKAAFANAFHITDAKTGAWSFDLSSADSAFLIPGDSVKIVATVTVDDGHGGTATQDETFNILGSNEPPTAGANSSGIQKGSSLAVSAANGVLTNAADPDRGDHLTISDLNGDAQNVGHSVQGQYGSVTLNADGSYSYTAKSGSLPSQIVPQDVFNYSVSDGHGGTSSSTLTITVLSPGQSYQAGSNTTLNGGNGKSVLDGTAGHDILLGGNGPDVLIGGPSDKLTGGNGPDIFVFGQHFGLNTITDFNVNNDAIQMSKALFASVSDLLSHTADSASGAVITASAGDQITLVGVAKAELLAHQADFILA